MSNRRRPTTGAQGHLDALLMAAQRQDGPAVHRAAAACLTDRAAARDAVAMLAWVAACFARRLPDGGAQILAELQQAPKLSAANPLVKPR